MTNPCTDAVLQMGKCAQIEPMTGIVGRSEEGKRPPDLEPINSLQLAITETVSRLRRYLPSGAEQNAS